MFSTQIVGDALSSFEPVSVAGKLLAIISIMFLAAAHVHLFYCVGRLMARVLPKSLAAALGDHWVLLLAAGSGGFAVIAGILAHLHLLYWQVGAVVGAILLYLEPGTLLSPQIFKSLWRQLSKWSALEKISLFLLICYLVPRFCEALVPSGQGDPIYYHVASAWLWGTGHGFQFFDWLPWFLQTGVYEYTYALLQTWIPNRVGLLIGCQIIHAVFGLLVAPLIVFLIANEILKNRLQSLLATFAFITLPYDPLTLVRAKNDAFVLSLILASLYAVVRLQWGKRPEYLGSIFLFAAFALAAKHTAFFYVLPLMLTMGFLLWRVPKLWRPQTIAPATLCFVVPACIWIRNFYYTGNPVFPGMSNLFPSPLIDEAIAKVVGGYTHSDAPLWVSLWAQIKIFLLIKPIYVLAGLAIFFVKDNALRLLLAIAGLSILLVVLITGTGTSSHRFFYFIYAPLSIAGIWGLAYLSQLISKRPQPLLLFVAAFGLMLPNSQLELPMSRLARRIVPFYASQVSFMSYLAAEKPLMHMFAWINEHVTSGWILSNATSESLFFSVPISIYEGEIRASRVCQAQSIEDFKKRFRETGFTHFLYVEGDENFDATRPWSHQVPKHFETLYIVGKFKLLRLR